MGMIEDTIYAYQEEKAKNLDDPVYCACIMKKIDKLLEEQSKIYAIEKSEDKGLKDWKK